MTGLSINGIQAQLRGTREAEDLRLVEAFAAELVARMSKLADMHQRTAMRSERAAYHTDQAAGVRQAREIVMDVVNEARAATRGDPS